MAEMEIRRAGPADARAFAEISVRGWQTAYRGIMPDDFLDGLSVDAREAAWRTRLETATDEAPAWIACRAGRAVGFLCGGPPRDEDAPSFAAEVYALYVLPEAWRGGVGRALLEASQEHWRETGLATATLWVLEANERARRFYEALGWRTDGGRQEVDLGGFAPAEVRYRRSLAR
jgi:ribosomal protein S18 acetylase RimI-like enzyme